MKNNNYLFENEKKFTGSIITRNIELKTNKIESSIIINPLVIKESKDEIKTDIIIDIFKKNFPNKTIKPKQYEIIKSIFDKKDTIGILPTGYGKSVCYQLPYFLNPDKIIIVVSPLISLMEDQKTKLENLNIPVACFHSNVGKSTKQKIKDELLNNFISSIDKDYIQINNEKNTDLFIDDEIKITKKKSNNKTTNKTTNKPITQKQSEDKKGMIILFTPEYLIKCGDWIKHLAIQNKLALIALDEAHCVSSWGHDFRPDYLGLYLIKEWIGEYNIPILALTATATKKVEEDIIECLGLTNPKIVRTPLDRPNLIISVKPKPKEFDILLEILDEYKNDFSIIYCKSRDKTEEVSEFLQSKQYNADVYHAGLTSSVRQEIQVKFANKQINIIVATIAFGMGIDQDVHLVVHWGCPSDMETYYQEIGRAGRDGVDSKCIMFYNNDDFRISRFFLKSLTDLGYKKFKEDQITKMNIYCLLNQCRRKNILSHFGEVMSPYYNCNKCDNCMRQEDVNIIAIDNLMYPIFIIAKTIFILKCKLGSNKLCLILRGSKSKTISDFFDIITFGLLKELTEKQIKQIINIMIINNYMKENTTTNGFGTILATTSQLVKWYSKVCVESKTKDTPALTKNLLTFDNLNEILNKQDNKLNLKIPIEYNDIVNIRFKTTIDILLNDFSDELKN